MNISLNPIPTTTPTVCGNCGYEERRLLHHVRHRGIFRRLCTSCVLRLHPQSFCPTCFLVYDRFPPPSNDTITCTKCYSSSHSNCIAANAAASPYICPPCSNPNAQIFDAKKVKDGEGEGGDANCREIDKKAAKVLLAAARIAAASMSKAAVAARAEAERRAKEAAFTRKRAREALEHVAFLVAKEKLKRKELSAVELSGSVNAVAKERNHKAGNANSVGVANEVSARLNAVGLREEIGSGRQNNGSLMAIEDNERMRVNPASTVGGRFVERNNKERSGTLGHLENNNGNGQKVNNGLYSVPSVGDKQQHMQNNNHGREDNMGSQH
ncbi:hypothetical protein U1Q18_035630 [Sarracenia purpurea var. burkii]